MNCVIAIETNESSRRATAEAFAQGAGLTIVTSVAEGSDTNAPRENLVLAMRDDGWELRDGAARPGRGMRIDFTQLGRRGRARARISRNQPLARAMGRQTQRVIDATAGMGSDAALLAAMGFDVLAIERHAALAALLADAIQRADADASTRGMLKGRLTVRHGDARSLLQDTSLDADCVYLDPMYPPKRKASALAKKEIRLVRALVGDDDDATELLAIARQRCSRVAVKRPTHADPLATDVTAAIESKLVRYDIYVQPTALPRRPEGDGMEP